MYTSSRVAWLHYIHVFLRIYTNKPQLKYTVTVDTPQPVSRVSNSKCEWFLLVRSSQTYTDTTQHNKTLTAKQAQLLGT